MLQILCEFDRVCKKDSADRFAKFWTEERVTKVLQLERKKKSAEPLVDKVGSITNVDLGREYIVC